MNEVRYMVIVTNGYSTDTYEFKTYDDAEKFYIEFNYRDHKVILTEIMENRIVD